MLLVINKDCKCLCMTCLDVAPLALIAFGALAREAPDVIDTLSIIDAWIGIALVVLEVAQVPGKP
jgi:hypothetical protein